jgi:hypothetical protein
VDAVCSNAASIPGFVELADLVYVGDPFTLRLAWDPANHRFLAGLNAGPDVALPYPATLTPNPGGPFSSISMIAAAANCEAAAGISDAEIEVREVRTNASAVIP